MIIYTGPFLFIEFYYVWLFLVWANTPIKILASNKKWIDVKTKLDMQITYCIDVPVSPL